MRPTETIIGSKALKIIREGVNAIYEPVRRTLGPYGKNALLYRTYNRGSRITNDGYTVAECQEPSNRFIKLVADTFKETCKKTNEKVGDGTTTTAIIGGKLFNDIYKLLSEGGSELLSKHSGEKSPIILKRKILESAEIVKQKIKEKAKKIESLEDLEKIAIVSIENETIGKIVAKLAWEVGSDGFIDVVEGYKGEIETEIDNRGMKFPAKVPAKTFINKPERYEMVAEDSHILVTNHKLDNLAEFSKSFQVLNTKTSKLIVVSPFFSNNVLVNIVNAVKQGFFIFPVHAPGLRTEQMEDLAVYCGATVIDKNNGRLLSNVIFEDLGFVEKLTVKDTELGEEAQAIGGRGTKEQSYYIKDKKDKSKTKLEIKSPIQKRIETLKGQLFETKQEQFKKMLERRIASLTSGVGTIRVGDSTQASSLYLKLKIEDGVNACRAALREGYVKGGGLCLKEIADTLPEDDMLKQAIMEPYVQIQNSREGGVEITDKIIDPADAVYWEVEYATSVVANLITVEIITPEIVKGEVEEGYEKMARALGEISIVMRRHFGQIKENEEEAHRDKMDRYILEGKLSTDEMVEVINNDEIAT